jgi:hypothetical protein
MASTPCIICHIITTTNRNERNEPVCSSCSNGLSFDGVSTGQVIELKIDMRKVKQSTLMQIRALIQKDIEDFEK